MAPVQPQGGGTRASARIRNLVHRDAKQKFSSAVIGDRPRTRAQKAALRDVLRSRPHTNTSGSATVVDLTGDQFDETSSTPDPSGDDDSSPEAPIPYRRPRRSSRQRAKQPRHQKLLTRRRQKAKPLVSDTTSSHHQGSGVIPDWIVPAMQLCWPVIFRHAATDAGILNGSWLLDISTVCKAFAEPALDVLYYSPAIRSEAKLLKLLASLERENARFNYPAKVHCLRLGPRYIPTNPLIETLVSRLPRLKHFFIDHQLDEPPYRDLLTSPRRTYPDLRKVLENRASTRPGMIEAPSRLLSWKWSWRLLGSLGLEEVIELHTNGPLSALTSLHLVNFPSIAQDVARDAEMAHKLDGRGGPDDDILQRWEEVVSSLKHLQSLTLEACYAVDALFLRHLPQNLKHLEIVHCWNLTTSDFMGFLGTHGRELVSLTLRHNQSLDLRFLTRLRDTCPKLEELVVNMVFYKDPDSNKAEPWFEEALSEGEVPAWPSSLRHLELLHVRPWTVDAALMFLESLVNQARDLPNLRYLVIKSMLDVDWRNRAVMRKEWLSRLQRVFLRRPKPPRPVFSLEPLRKAKAEAEAAAAADADVEMEGGGSSSHNRAGPSKPTRRSRRVSDLYSDSCPSSASSVALRRPNYAEPPSDIEDDSDMESGDGDGDGEDSDVEMSEAPSSVGPAGDCFVQGMCSRVEFTMENHKLAEVQYDMDDFMDAGEGDSALSDPDFST